MDRQRLVFRARLWTRRHRPDRTIEFLGRGDEQINTRGYRIEPEEVSAALIACRHACAARRLASRNEPNAIAVVILHKERIKRYILRCIEDFRRPGFGASKPHFMIAQLIRYADLKKLTPPVVYLPVQLTDRKPLIAVN